LAWNDGPHHTEEEDESAPAFLNAKKAISGGKALRAYQVRVYEMVTKLNRTAGTHKLQAEVAQAKAASKGAFSRKSSQKKSVGAPVKAKPKHTPKAKPPGKPHRRK
jgi:hypothetical protein